MTAEQSAGQAYKVLARRYRPTRFADMIGQEALVRTLTNAISAGRVAQAFIFTGVRGVGKTTTARLLARALNCEGEGATSPVTEPCGLCSQCQAIAEDRHVDVMEMDAASRTGVDDIREIIDGVRYRPVQARTKVYIIDEVHMLSRNAFNALLKTLEEPPSHVVFIFATTEIRKVPVTVLSRCQRFDLRRVPQESLQAHFAKLCDIEAIEAEEAALVLIARAADGSVRDGLSLLDQAVALGEGQVTAERVQEMLGLADRGRLFDLLDCLFKGDLPEALAILNQLYDAGADPATVLQDLLEATHEISRAKALAGTRAAAEKDSQAGEMAEKLSMPALSRVWQILLKGFGETQRAPRPHQAAEMVLIRLGHASELPPPGDIIKQLEKAPQASAPVAASSSQSGGGTSAASSSSYQVAPTGGSETLALAKEPDHLPAEMLEPVTAPVAVSTPTAEEPGDLRALVALAQKSGEMRLASHIMRDLHLVRFESGRLEFSPGERAPSQLAGQISQLLESVTGRRWMVSVSRQQGDEALYAQDQAAERAKEAAAMEHPLVLAALETFPEAKFVERRDLEPPRSETNLEAREGAEPHNLPPNEEDSL